MGAGELSYTFVIETDNGRTLVHPQLPEPEAIQEDPVVIIISDLETSPGKKLRMILSVIVVVFYPHCIPHYHITVD